MRPQYEFVEEMNRNKEEVGPGELSGLFSIFLQLSDFTLLFFFFLKKEHMLHNTFRRIDRIFFKQNTTDENVAIVFKSVFVLNVKGCSSICWTSNTLIIILVKY